MAALWRRDYDGWAARAFPWALGGFLVLGTAILMGGYWAYKTLGWGGYWGWDPVENASLIPWLLGTALIHGLYLERTRGRYRRANLVLASLGLPVGALRHLPHPLGRARRLLGAQLRRPRDLRLADRPDGLLRRCWRST